MLAFSSRNIAGSAKKITSPSPSGARLRPCWTCPSRSLGPFSCGFARLDFACQRTRGWHNQRGATNRSGHPSMFHGFHVDWVIRNEDFSWISPNLMVQNHCSVNKKCFGPDRKRKKILQEATAHVRISWVTMPSLYQFDFTPPRREKCAVNGALVWPRPNMRATPRHSPGWDHLEPKWLRLLCLRQCTCFIMFPGQQLILFKFGLNGLSMFIYASRTSASRELRCVLDDVSCHRLYICGRWSWAVTRCECWDAACPAHFQRRIASYGTQGAWVSLARTLLNI